MRTKNIITILSLLVVAGVLFIVFAYNNMHPKAYETILINNAGEEIGTAIFVEMNDGVQITVQAQGLAQGAGTHAIHIHEKADCTPLESFKNTGGHFNPAGKDHGLHSANGQHAGDMPNIITDANGDTTSVMVNHHITLQKKDIGQERFSVFDADGSALIIHAGEDDYKSQPSGAAGPRIACGKIKSP
ncbi:MAG: superoxide dismutase family protein [Alphaproteobacteria bacterium]|nr:superoxide dismutase family protein [Alphaproteobacteria bacterium]